VPTPDDLSPLDDPGEGLPEPRAAVVPAGESAAMDRLQAFDDHVDSYGAEQDRIDLDSTSHLSVDLKYGWIGPRRVVTRMAALRRVAGHS